MCLEAEGKKVIQCGHPMCEGCAKEWFLRSSEPTCPLCRGPFRGRIVRKWVQEKQERDEVFEAGLEMILASRRCFTVERLSPDARVVWMRPVSKVEKLREFQEAYNFVKRTWGDMEWDEEDIEDFVKYDVLNEYKDDKGPKVNFREFRERRAPKRVHWKR